MEQKTNLKPLISQPRSYVSESDILEWRTIEGDSKYALVGSSKYMPRLTRAALRAFKYGVVKYHPVDETLLKHITRPILNRLASLPIFCHPIAKIRPLNGEILGLKRQFFTNEAELIGHMNSSWVEQSLLPEKLLIYFPGGGYVAGSSSTHRRLTTTLTKHLNMNIGILVANYRHAPRADYQGALMDAMSVYDHVIRVWGFDPKNIILAGDSAGANLTFCLLQDLMRSEKPLPSAMVGLSGFYDAIEVLERSEKCAFICPHKTKQILHHVFQLHHSYYAEHYNPTQVLNHLAEYKKDFSFYLQSGSHETFISESIYLKKVAHQLGLHITLDCFDRMGHIFQILPTEESSRALQAVGNYLNERLG